MSAETTKRFAKLIEPFRVPPGSQVTLEQDFDPGFTSGMVREQDGAALLEQGVQVLSKYQDRLAAQGTHGMVVILQGLDAAGKDSTIRHVMSGVNPQGVTVESFKAPSDSELAQDFLRRFQERLPLRGGIGIFNRSHYEEVLIARVHTENLERQKMPPEARGPDVWSRRYRAINDWERYLSENGFHVVKLCLNISEEEQRLRFLRRIDLPTHNWKLSPADLQERQYWSRYQEAYSAMLTHTSTDHAPWYVIPADHKWFARIAAAAVIGHALLEIHPEYPQLDDDARGGLQAMRAQLESEAPVGRDPKAVGSST